MYLSNKLLLFVFIIVFSLSAHSEKSDDLKKVITKYNFNTSEFSFGFLNLANDEIVALHNEKKLFNSASLVKIITTYIF